MVLIVSSFCKTVTVSRKASVLSFFSIPSFSVLAILYMVLGFAHQGGENCGQIASALIRDGAHGAHNGS